MQCSRALLDIALNGVCGLLKKCVLEHVASEFSTMLNAVLMAIGSTVAGATTPNIMLVVADDFGWCVFHLCFCFLLKSQCRYNSGWHAKNDTNVVTPTLNALVAEGLELDRMYVYKVKCVRLTIFNTHVSSTISTARPRAHPFYLDDCRFT
jgi:hypothetical protein